MRSDREHHEQKALMELVRFHERKCPALGLLYAIPNGGHRNVIVAAKLKAEGVKAGMPDLHLPIPCGGYASLYVEMKVKGGRISDAQRAMHEKLRAAGNRVVVCFGADEAWKVLMKYLELP